MKPAQTDLNQNRFEWLDALRGIAALAVMIYHARAILWIGLAETWLKFGFKPDLNAAIGYALAPFSFGYLGVTLFFVISGFSIHLRGSSDLATKGKNADLPLKTFYLKRFIRLYPTYFFALLLTAVIDAYLVVKLPELAGKDDHSWRAFFSTMLGFQGILSPHYGSASVFWTLILEMHFYLAYPLLFHFSRIKGPTAVIAATLLIQVATLIAVDLFDLKRVFPYWYAGGPIFLKFWFTWTVGFYVAEITVGRAKSGLWFSAPVALISLMVGVLGTAMNLSDYAETPLAIFIGWVILCESRRKSAPLWQSWIKPLAFFGVIGYCVYCIHLPLLRLTRTTINSGLPSESILPVFAGALVALIGAVVLFFVIDRRAIEWSRRAGHKTSS